MEGTPEQAPVNRLRGAPVGAVGLDPAAQRDIMAGQGSGQQGQLVGRRGQVGVGEDDVLTLAR